MAPLILLMSGRGLTYDDLITEKQTYRYSIETFEEHYRIWLIIREAFVYPEGIGECRKYYILLESYLNFLDYVEVNELDKRQKYAS